MHPISIIHRSLFLVLLLLLTGTPASADGILPDPAPEPVATVAGHVTVPQPVVTVVNTVEGRVSDAIPCDLVDVEILTAYPYVIVDLNENCLP